MQKKTCEKIRESLFSFLQFDEFFDKINQNSNFDTLRFSLKVFSFKTCWDTRYEAKSTREVLFHEKLS